MLEAWLALANVTTIETYESHYAMVSAEPEHGKGMESTCALKNLGEEAVEVVPPFPRPSISCWLVRDSATILGIDGEAVDHPQYLT